MTYAFRHIGTLINPSNTATVSFPLLGQELKLHNVAHLELRIRSSSTVGGTDRLLLFNTTSYTYNTSLWSFDEATVSVQGNNAAGANAQNAMLLGVTTFGTFGDIRVFFPFIHDPELAEEGLFGFLTVLSRSSHYNTTYNAGTYDRILEFSNSSVSAGVEAGIFLDACSFGYQSGAVVAGSQFSLYGWSE